MKNEVFDEEKKNSFRSVVYNFVVWIILNFRPSRRKQAKGQDIIQWEQENTFKISKRSPSSPWGNARPVKEQKGCPNTQSPLKVKVEQFQDTFLEKSPKTPSKTVA